ncbi:amidohydrolase family protein [Streptomyces atroolivaceus]|uniref:amidohydrolase family protein n=1 Tax=Streptomyces atroolivaceus TaxID=66869 RepID=UPI0037B1DFDC
MEALVAATRNNVERLGLSGQVGVITPGAQADLAIWNGNPLETRNCSPTPPTPSS